ncbi:MAG: hypothetical protein Q4B64_09360 [Spirochaetales bacterium]|nr:hypothetical protein [Spirochaetales bacterium]
MFVTFKRFIFNKCLDFLPSSCFGYRRFVLRLMDVEVSPSAKINSGFRAYGPGKIIIKDNVWIGQNCRIYTGGFNKVTIGENCEIGPETVFNCQSHNIEGSDHRAGKCIHHDIELGKGIWCGMRAMILCEKVGSGSVIGAGALVLDEVPENVLAAGVPATVKKELSR